MRKATLGLSLVLLSLTASLADARPSFRCDGRLNQTERTICADDRLGALDRRMVAVYRDVVSGLSRSRREDLGRDQRSWRARRDSCRRDRRCITAAYESRIDRLVRIARSRVGSGISGSGSSNPPPSNAGSGASGSSSTSVSARVLPDGTFERTLADGRKFQRLPNGSIQYVNTDGSITKLQMSVGAQAPIPPAFPPEFDNWSDRIGEDLLTILGNILSDSEYQSYLETEKDRSGPSLISWRLDSVEFLTNEP